MNMFREERNEGGIGHQRESQSGRGGQYGGLVAEKKKRTFARTRCFHDGRQHEARSLRELALSRKSRPEFRKRLDRVQQPP